MHSEWGSVEPTAAAMMCKARRAGGKLVAIGTTTARLLETAADSDGCMQPWTGQTRLFIRPPYRFRAVDALLTNFHLRLLVFFRGFAMRRTAT
jgi:S-adenosylmethionine:tRNA ribosyltransferase-isomerase